MLKIKILFFILLFVLSCQPVEVLDEVIFDYNQLTQISINANEKLINEPELINTDPYVEGWIVKINIVNKSDINELLDNISYKQLVE